MGQIVKNGPTNVNIWPSGFRIESGISVLKAYGGDISLGAGDKGAGFVVAIRALRT
jgi:hypothetical protein